ncbi:uncharacterized protein [Anomalospiza imberbis]|uniref:uncharacterized protein n=1 Tax=Anomalospiza imberbis TaxID=187417 RepID=UPI00358EE31F
MRQMLKEMLQAGQEMEGEAVLKAEFPGGSSGSLAAPAAGREAMPGTVTGDEVDGKASPLAWLNEILKPLEPPADVSAGRIFPVPLLIPTHKPGSHGEGPLRGKNKGRGKKKFREPNNILKPTVMELQKEHGESISPSLPLGLSIRGLSLHIWARRARHSGKGSMVTWLPCCCFHGLQGCLPAWPGCSFSPASAGRHLAPAAREPNLQHGPGTP